MGRRRVKEVDEIVSTGFACRRPQHDDALEILTSTTSNTDEGDQGKRD